MSRMFGSAALALALGVGLAAFAPHSAQAAACIRQAALDLNGDGWINTAEFHMAQDAGFKSVRSAGRLHITTEDMNRCLQGSDSAFRWLQSANPRYASFMGPAPTTYAATTTAVGSTYPNPQTYYSRYDAGAAYDTPTPQANEAALAYLRSKVYGNPAYQTTVTRGATVQQMQPVYTAPAAAAAPADGSYALLAEFDRIDLNRDGVVSRGEYLDYMTRAGRAY